MRGGHGFGTVPRLYRMDSSTTRAAIAREPTIPSLDADLSDDEVDRVADVVTRFFR